MANLVYSSAIDSESTVTAPVKLEDHALIGAAAVAMPGTTLGKGSTLGALAASLPGAQLPGEAAPAMSGSSLPKHTLQLQGRRHLAPVYLCMCCTGVSLAHSCKRS